MHTILTRFLTVACAVIAVVAFQNARAAAPAAEQNERGLAWSRPGGWITSNFPNRKSANGTFANSSADIASIFNRIFPRVFSRQNPAAVRSDARLLASADRFKPRPSLANPRSALSGALSGNIVAELDIDADVALASHSSSAGPRATRGDEPAVPRPLLVKWHEAEILNLNCTGALAVTHAARLQLEIGGLPAGNGADSAPRTTLDFHRDDAQPGSHDGSALRPDSSLFVFTNGRVVAVASTFSGVNSATFDPKGFDDVEEHFRVIQNAALPGSERRKWNSP